MKIKTIAAIVTALLLMTHIRPVCVTRAQEVSAASAIVMETTTHRVLYEKNADAQMSMASTTKIMTALLAVESGLWDREITITAEMLKTEGSSIYLKEGDVLTLEALVLGLMLESGNDAALSIAVALAGSEAAFAEQMNQRAAEIGMTDTHFVTSSGLDHDEHYTTARDMALLACTAMNHPLFEAVAARKEATVEVKGVNPRKRTFTNHNRLLKETDGFIGVKTGFTKKSGRCLVSCCQRNGIRVVTVTLKDPDDWNDHRYLTDLAFTKVETAVMGGGGLQITVPVVGGTASTIRLKDPLPQLAVIPNGRSSDIIMKIETEPFLYAPVYPEQDAGRVTFWLDGELIGESVLLTDENVDYVVRKRPWWQRLWQKLLQWLGFGK
jgi:D-alanyl-D-alanine carboxypeptidase/D-alanyl-D-alanine carboxypeptidase (penicillin-binding protein 5/6)